VQEESTMPSSQITFAMEQTTIASDEAAYQAQAAAAAALTDGMAEMQYTTSAPIQHSAPPDDDLGLRARALYDYQAGNIIIQYPNMSFSCFL
jgi:hypothetical protein